MPLWQEEEKQTVLSPRGLGGPVLSEASDGGSLKHGGQEVLTLQPPVLQQALLTTPQPLLRIA
jgi:hypothetical protein